jgi:hypothetical protein
MTDISIVIYSYKGKNLADVLESLLESASSEIHITVYDQHPMDRKEKLSKLHNIQYRHIFWDEILSPTSYKAGGLNDENIVAPYSMLISDDIQLADGWDKTLIRYISENNKIVSGFSSGKLMVHDKYFLRQEVIASDGFATTNYINTNFIFARTETLRNLKYPDDVKYFGEAEKLSMDAFIKNVDVVCAPSNILKKDFGDRTMENLYVPFSTEHNYNSCIDMMLSEEYSGWVEFHGLSDRLPKKLPYQIDDVLYNPYDLKFNDVEQDRFIGLVKAIY